MGPGFESACRKISRRDLDWLDQQAGVQVIAQPGDLLLNKKPDRQNLGVGFRTTVFASPGSTTVANGIAVYCIDHDKSFPLDEGFDVGPAGGELPGYEGIVKLLQLNATLQPGLNDTVDGMQAAIWNLTDASPLATSGTADASRALLAQAGVAEDSVPGGLPPIADPNADAIETGTVGASGEVMPTTPAVAIEPPPPVRVDTAQLFPAQLRAGRGLRGDLLVGANGDVKQLDVRIERGTGRRWTRVRSLARRPLEAGLTPVTLSLGTLRAGRYRLVVSVSGSLGTPAVARAAFTVR